MFGLGGLGKCTRSFSDILAQKFFSEFLAEFGFVFNELGQLCHCSMTLAEAFLGAPDMFIFDANEILEIFSIYSFLGLNNLFT